jgi:5-methylcytosine-specific restriction endonuclease McrA
MILSEELRAIPVCWEMFVTTQHYRAWKAGNPLRTHKGRAKVDRDVRDVVKRECGYRCQGDGCRNTELLTLEHIIPAVLGGSNNKKNLTLFCSSCQRRSWARFREVLKAVDAEAAA